MRNTSTSTQKTLRSFEIAPSERSTSCGKGQLAQTFGGTYSVEGNVLALERSDGGALIAKVTVGGERQVNFKMLGAPADDPGLDFSK